MLDSIIVHQVGGHSLVAGDGERVSVASILPHPDFDPLTRELQNVTDLSEICPLDIVQCPCKCNFSSDFNLLSQPAPYKNIDILQLSHRPTRRIWLWCPCKSQSRSGRGSGWLVFPGGLNFFGTICHHLACLPREGAHYCFLISTYS